MSIQLEQLEKQFGDKRVLNGVSLNIHDGQFVALLGPSGCGKTTLLNALSGLLDIDGGRIEVGGAVWSRAGYTLPAEQRNVGMVFQDFALWPHMNVRQNVAFGLKMKKMPESKLTRRVADVLAMVHMESYAQHFPHQLSGGQKQRVAIARALAPEPTLMLMDEPLSSLDAKLREQMRWELLRVVREAGITTVYVTHDQVEALSMADQVVLLNQGKIEQQGSPKELYNHPTTTFAATFVGASNLIEGKVVQKEGTHAVLDCAGQVLHCTTDHAMGEQITLMIRPGDIVIVEDHNAKRSNNNVNGIITQRAFHGVTWQYRVAVSTWEFPVEVWAGQEINVGTDVTLFLPSEKCRPVKQTENHLLRIH